MSAAIVFIAVAVVSSVLLVVTSGSPVVYSPFVTVGDHIRTPWSRPTSWSMPTPVENFGPSEDDFALPQVDEAVDDASNEVPKYPVDAYKPEQTSSFLKDNFLASESAATAASPPTTTTTVDTTSPVDADDDDIEAPESSPASSNPSSDQQSAQLGSVEYQPDPPVFDRRILLKLKHDGLLKQNS